LLDRLDETARRVGAVNTVVVEDGGLAGYNSDVHGAIAPLERVCALEGRLCGVIGAGGAARAVVYGLLSRGARVTVFTRDPKKGAALGESFGVEVEPLASLESSEVEIVINTTPVGMRGHSEGTSPVSRSALRGRRVVYDLIYTPLETRFLADAKAEDCQMINGLEMLAVQAEAQFELWTGRKPPDSLMEKAALESITAR